MNRSKLKGLKRLYIVLLILGIFSLNIISIFTILLTYYSFKKGHLGYLRQSLVLNIFETILFGLLWFDCIIITITNIEEISENSTTFKLCLLGVFLSLTVQTILQILAATTLYDIIRRLSNLRFSGTQQSIVNQLDTLPPYTPPEKTPTYHSQLNVIINKSSTLYSMSDASESDISSLNTVNAPASSSTGRNKDNQQHTVSVIIEEEEEEEERNREEEAVKEEEVIEIKQEGEAEAVEDGKEEASIYNNPPPYSL